MVFQVQEKNWQLFGVGQRWQGSTVSFLGISCHQVYFLVLNINFITGGRDLVEYDIEKEVLDFYSVGNVSHAEAKVLFRRKMEYHVTNTFLQSFILVLVGYMSYYFDVENFTDRIMVALTLMLVVATITSTIQAVWKNSFCIL